VGALTQLTHEGPRNLVNCSPQWTTTLCTGHQCGRSGPCPVDIAMQVEADGLTFAQPFAHCRQYYSTPHCIGGGYKAINTDARC